MQQEYDYLFKFLLVGNSSVGKSSILLRFSDQVFNENFLPTIGVDFKIRTFDLSGKTIKTQIWDTAGQERFKTITSTYYKGAQGVILVYDITDAQSFKDVENWMLEVEKHAQDNIVKLLGIQGGVYIISYHIIYHIISIFQVGNKIDMEDKRQVSYEDGSNFARERGMKFLETSAKESTNVDKAFFQLSQEVRQQIATDETDVSPSNQPKNKLRNTQNIKKDEKKCC